MTARKCFAGKMRNGKVPPRAGAQILDMLDGFEAEHQSRLGDGAAARQAALDAAEAAAAEAARKADLARRSAIAQANVLRATGVYGDVLGTLRASGRAPIFMKGEHVTPLGAAARSLLARDPFEIATWGNVHKLAQDIRGRAHATFTGAIEALRVKRFGFKPETAKELDVLRAAHGEQAGKDAPAIVDAWRSIENDLADQFIAAGGDLVKRQDYFPNPAFDPAKVRAIGFERFRKLVDENVDRDRMLEFGTGARLSDARYDELVRSAFEAIRTQNREGPPTASATGRPMLANSRAAARFFMWKDAGAWRAVADAVGMHSSPFEAMVQHIAGMADDIAAMRILGPNPEATKRFILSMFDREAARLAPVGKDGELAEATKTGRKIEARVRTERKLFEALYDEVNGANRVPVNPELARKMAEARSWLVASQLGSAIVSSITDPAMVAMAGRWTGIPAHRILMRAAKDLFRPGSEMEAAQLGLVADSLAHGLGEADRVMGETIRTGTIMKLGTGVIRLSGLRRWTAVLKNAFGMETMAYAAREAGKRFGDLDPEFRRGLERYGIGADDWDAIRNADAYEPRPRARFVRPLDVDDGSPLGRQASEKWAQFINTEMDYAVIDQDPATRAILLGQSRPGTAGGEVRRATTMYRAWTATLMTTQFMRAFARGFDGTRLRHGALTLIAMTFMGALAMQAKEVLSGRDPLNMDPTDRRGLAAWGKALLQGGGLGVFGDILFTDQTRFGQSWASTGGGAIVGAVDAILGDFLLGNIQRAVRGEETHFLGDGLYVAGRYLPGSSLWFGRLAFQRAVLDQAALLVDDRAPERFAGMEGRAARDWGQRYWFRPGQATPERAPDFGAVAGP